MEEDFLPTLENQESRPQLTEPLPGLELTEQDWREYHDKVIEALKEAEYIEIDDKGDIHANIDALKEFKYRSFRDAHKLHNEPISTKAEMFGHVFANKQVYLKGREEEGKKPLVFIPDTEEDIANIEQMRNSWMSLDQFGKTREYTQKKYPTRERGFDSDISLLDVAVPYLVYANGNGQRDNSGILWVDKDSKRVPVSGKWFTDNGLKGPSGTQFSDSPRRVVEEYGAIWMKHGLLTPNDMPEASWAKKERQITNDNGRGRVTIDGKIFYTGTDYAGGIAQPLSRDQYILTTPDGHQSLLQTSLSREDLAEVNVINREQGKKQLSVPQSATHISEISDLGSFSNFSYEGNKKNREVVDMSREVPSLLTLRESLREDTVDALSTLTLEDQVRVSMMIRDLGENGRGVEFIDTLGENGMRLLADMRARGGADRRVVEELLHQDVQEAQSLLGEHRELRHATETLMNELYKEAEKRNLDPTKLVLIDRVSDAMKSRSVDLLHAAMAGESTESQERMALLTEGTNKLIELLKGTSTELQLMPDVKQGAVTGLYTFKDQSTLAVTVRPKSVETAQARIGFKYKDADGRIADFRIDHDDYGISLDISRRGAGLAQDLDDLGKTYHTQGMFEKGLTVNSQEFEEFASMIPSLLNWE